MNKPKTTALRRAAVAVALSVATLGVAANADAAAPAKGSARPMAQCKDGTTSYSKNHRGTCSHHGGVRRWYR